MDRWRLRGVLAWVLSVGILLVGFTIAAQDLLDEIIIEETAAENLHAEFLRAADSISRSADNSKSDIHDIAMLREAFQDILELRPGIRLLEVFDVSSNASALILSSEPRSDSRPLSTHEQTEVSAGRSVAIFDDTTRDRAWIITAPIKENGRVVGALRGRFSQWKYDHLIKKERELAKAVGVTAVLVTSLVFVALIRIIVHRPIRQLLQAMQYAEAGDLTRHAPVVGPADLQKVASQFNRLLDRINEEIATKERLLGEIRVFNDTLAAKVSEATEELRQAHRMLVETQIQAERAEKLAALGELSATVAHELGNPLNAIFGHFQMLVQDPVLQSRARKRHLTIIRSEIDRMTTILRHILDSTRIQVRSTSVDLNAVVRDVLAVLAPTLASRQIIVKMYLMPDLPPVNGDRLAIHGMLFNLVTNAFQAMPQGGEINVTTVQFINETIMGTVVLRGTSALEAGAVRLSIRDTGHGIPQEQMGRIFDPFFTTRSHEGGTGLGLAICRRVVSFVGGQLAVQSTVDHGTLFTIDLPIWREARHHGELDGR